MAYMNQEKKGRLAPTIKAVLKKYGVKGSLSVRTHSSLVLTLTSGPVDFIANYNKVENVRNVCKPGHMRDRAGTYLNVNPYWYHEHFDGKAKAFLEEVLKAMNEGNHDNSDIQSDFFDVGWYVDVKIGTWDKPYVVTK